MWIRYLFALVVTVAVARALTGDEPKPGEAATPGPPTIARKLPPPAKPLDDADRAKLQSACDEVRNGVKWAPSRDELLEIEVLSKALDYAVLHNEIFDPKA